MLRRRVLRPLEIAAVAVCLAGSSSVAAAQSDLRVAAFLKSVNSSITGLAGEPDAICSRIVASAINMDAGVASALGHSQASSKQRSDYRRAAERWAVRDCVRRNQDNGGNPLVFVGVRQGESGDVLLATHSIRPARSVIWRLRGAGTLRAVDVIIDGRSMTLALRDETNALLDRSNGDIERAIEALGR
jgi:hypothetical protein